MVTAPCVHLVQGLVTASSNTPRASGVPAFRKFPRAEEKEKEEEAWSRAAVAR